MYIDNLLATEVERWLGSSRPANGVNPAATWSLCNILADHGLCVSDSTGVSLRKIGPFRVAVKEDKARDLQQMLQVVVPVALSTALGSPPATVAACVAALTFALQATGTVLTSGTTVDEVEWQVLLFVHKLNSTSKAQFPTIDQLVQSLSGHSTEARLREAVASLMAKKPLWGSERVALLRYNPDGGLEAPL